MSGRNMCWLITPLKMIEDRCIKITFIKQSKTKSIH